MVYKKMTPSEIKHEAYVNSPEFRDDLIKEFLDSKSSDGRIKGYNYEDGFEQPEPTYNNPLGFVTDYRMALKRDSDAYKAEQNSYNSESAPGSRSALNRMFDMLQVGQYAIQGGINGAITGKGVDNGVWEGIKAGNPFGAGNEKGEFTFSQNLGELGWNPTSTGGKVAKGVVGFIGDVALDPLTYVNPLSVGGSAVFKGTGQKVGKEIVEKFTPEMAEKVLRQTGKEIPKAEEVTDLVRRVNKSRGIVEEGTGRGFGIYGDNIPFADKLGLAGKKSEWVSEAKLRAFGDATIAPYMNKIGDSLLHSKAGKLFSNKADLLDLARRDPNGLAMGYEFARKAGKANLTYKDALVELKDEYAKIKALDPDSQKMITKMLEDTSLWDKMTTYKSSAEIKEFQDLHSEVEKFVKDYGMENKDMQKVMSEIIPKFKSGEQVTMRFPGMKDHKVFIEGMTGLDKNGVKHYKIRGYDKNIPETAFYSADDIAKENLAVHMTKEKASVEAGDTGRINISNPSSELDDAIESGVIPITSRKPKSVKNNPYKDYKTNPNDYVNDVATDTLDNKIANYEERWLANQEKEVTNKEVIKNTTSPKIDETDGKVFKDGKWVDKPNDIGIINHSSVKFAERDATMKATDKSTAYKEMKKFITNKVRVNEDGKIVKDGKIVGDARNMKDSTPLAHLTGIKGLNKNAWNTAKKDLLTTRSFFERLVAEEPSVNDLFEGLIKTGSMNENPSMELMTHFIDSYFEKPHYDPSDLVHTFHKDYGTITRMLEEKYGSYNMIKKRDAVAKKLNAEKATWDGTGLKPLEDGVKRKRMEDFYKIMNNPDSITRAERQFAIDDAKGMTKMAEYDASGVLKSYKNGEAETAFDKASNEYVNADQNIKDLTDQKVEYVVMHDGNFVGKVEKLDEDKLLYKNKDGQEIEMSKKDLEASGFTMFEPKPQTSVTGTKIKGKDVGFRTIEKTGNQTTGEMLGEGEAVHTGFQKKTNDLEEAYQNNLKDSSSDLFKAKDEISASKYVDDDPLETPKTQQQLNDDFVNAEDDIPSVSTKSESVITKEPTPVHVTTNSNEAKTVINDEFNLGLISETVDDMMGKEVQGAYKTVEQALSELPTDIDEIIAKGAEDKAKASLLEQKLTTYRQALTTQTEFERFAKTLWGDTKYDNIMKEHSTTIRAIDTFELADRDIVKIAEDIRKNFKSVAEMESAIGHLDNKIIEGYVYHKVNPLFKSPLAEFTQDELDNMGIKIPKNQFEIGREYKKGTVMPDGHTLEKGTIEEINEHILKFGEDLNKKLIAQGKEPRKLEKLFEEEISDIYLARMQGHYKLMYDDAVYGDITMKFGKKYEGNALEEGKSLTVSTQALRKSLKKKTPEEQEAILASYGFTKDEFNKLGNSFKRIDKDVADKITNDGFAEVHQVSNVVLDKAEKLAHVQMAEDVHGLLGAYDKFLNMYKLMVTAYRPAFHFNNAKGNMFNNYLDVGSKALSPKYNMSAIDMVKGKNLDKVIELGGTKYTYKEIVDELTIQGKIGNGFFGTDIKKVLEKEMTDKLTDTPLKKLMKKPTELGSAIEDQGKLVNFMANLDKRMSFSEAGEHVDKFLFDYSDITKFEQEAMKRIFPFYTWMRKNAPLQLEQMLTNPKRYAPVAKAIGEMEGMVDKNKRIDKEKVPAFAKDWVQLPFNIMGDNGNMEALMWSNNLPYMDINKIPNILSPKDSAINIFESSTPAIKMPVELGTNYNYFFDRKIDKGEKVLDPSGKFEVSPQTAYVLSQIPQYAEPGGVIKKKGIDRLIHILDKGMASGVKSYDNAGYGGTTGGSSSYQEQTNNIDPQTGYPIKRHSVSGSNDDFVPPYIIDELTKNLFSDEGKNVPSEDIPMFLGGEYFRQNK